MIYDPITGTYRQNTQGMIYDPITGTYRQQTLYVPTSTNFTTNNVGAQFSNNPALSSVQVHAANTINPVQSAVQPAAIVAPRVFVNNPTPAIVTAPPVIVSSPGPIKATPVSPLPEKGMKWSGTYTVRGGDTLGGIASMVTNNLRAAGAPPSTQVTYQMLYSNNQSVIDSTANSHGNPIAGGPWNNIFPGEVIRIPVWA
jgi:hypothetical protein